MLSAWRFSLLVTGVLAALVSSVLALLLPDAMALLVLDSRELLVLDSRELLELDSLVMLRDSLVWLPLVLDAAKDWKIDVTMVGISSEVRFLAVSSCVWWCCRFARVGGSLCSRPFVDLFLLADDFAVVLFLEDLRGMAIWQLQFE